ncbi:hypothetical protein OOK31_25335 [Streptomyces sp. NBC_00249]|uniref:hypothetical protein n=1 Tax=Streptomyces sp. NBC_00249 TaxID=2975690 RepID=UPI00225C30F5|nr:hypothetical protein [Streptomyces sp. NBC_00249]MCX5197180.1 hypothetical protein [Streptomyces sp. NBC_00249]
MTHSPTPTELLALRTANAAVQSSPDSTYDIVATAVFALGSAQLLQSPETAAELSRLRAGLSPEREQEIRARRLDEITAGPWLVADGEDGRPVVYTEGDGATRGRLLLAAVGASEADVQFVCSARRSVPELLDEVVRLRARVAELEAERTRPAPVIDPIAALERLHVDLNEGPEPRYYRLGRDLPEVPRG